MAKSSSRTRQPARPKAGTAAPVAATRSNAVLAAVLVGAALVALAVPSVQPQSLGMDLVAVWVGVAAIAGAVGVLLAPPAVLPVSRLSLAWAAFLAWTLLSALVSGRVWAALVGESTSRLGWMTLVALTAVAFAASLVSVDVKALLRRHAWWVVLAESVLILYQLMVTESASVGGFLPNSTYAGEALVLLLPWVLPDASVAERDRWVRYASIAVTVGALAAVQSRAALLVAAAWCVWAIARRWKASVRVKAGALALLLAATAAATALVLPASVFDPDGTLPFGGRLAAWELSAEAVAARPLVGWGADSYWPAAASVRTLEKAAEAGALVFGAAATDPHNAFVWVALAGGVVGLVLFVWFLAELGIRWRRTAPEDPDRSAAIWGVAGCFAVGLAAPIALHVLVLFALVFGVSIATPTPVAARAGTGERAVLPVKAVLAACAVVALLLSLNALTRARYERTDAQRSPALAPGAIAASRLWALDAHLASRASLHAGWAAQADPAGGWVQADLDALERAFAADRRNPSYALERAKALGTFGSDAAVVDAAFEAAFERYPAYPPGRAEYAVYLAQTGRLDEARAQLDAIAAINDADPSRIAAVEAAEAAIEAAGQ